MITHVFYHQETVEGICAENSWRSVRPSVGRGDEVILLDLGRTLPLDFEMDADCKFLRVERIRTDRAEERSYTFGLNQVIPGARFEWVVLWRSDYIYHERYFAAMRAGMGKGNFVLPYEAFIGAEWTGGDFCREHWEKIRTAGEAWFLENGHVCAVYESMDFPHWAIRKDLYVKAGGMDERLWGYGWQFPWLYRKVRELAQTRAVFEFEMMAFHQNHGGSFGLGQYTPAKHQEMVEGDRKLRAVLGSKEAETAFKKERQAPLRPRRSEASYRPKVFSGSESTKARAAGDSGLLGK